MTGKVLIVDDEISIRELLKFNLQKEGYSVFEAEDGITGVSIAKADKPDLIILDLMLPGLDGIDVCRSLKNGQTTAGIPIIMLTAKADEVDKVIGLEMGADDYLTKPFSTRELMARVKAVLRRSQKDMQPTGELIVGNLKLNFSRYEAHLGKEKLELTPKEYELIKLFATNIGKVFTREQLLDKIWGYEYYGDTRTVDVHVRHLRAKLEKDKSLANAIETVRGVGYRMDEAIL